MLVRTWNVFHGHTKPPRRRAFLPEAVELAVSGQPDVVCLQELPVWSLRRLEGWSGYKAVTAVAAPPMFGPLPSTAEAGRRLTALHAGVLRSAFSGQANAILVSRRYEIRERHARVLNPESFRRAEARRLRLGLVARLAWAKERRVCQVARLREGARTLVVANLHATSYPPDDRLADAELGRAFAFVGALAPAGEPVVVAGDFNVTFERSRTLQRLAAPGSGFSRPGAGIDHIVVRGCAVVSGPTAWPLERREYGGVRISDHAPVEAVLA